ncbi:MAG: hypothetical protein ACXV3F_02960 [Frankiaceae bacterium]
MSSLVRISTWARRPRPPAVGPKISGKPRAEQPAAALRQLPVAGRHLPEEVGPLPVQASSASRRYRAVISPPCST